MLDSILIGLSGMEGFSKGLKVISNNVANLNTPGFKSSNLQFTDAYYQQSGGGGANANGESTSFGTGLAASTSIIDFKAGELQSSSDPLDTAISGAGYYVVRDAQSQTQSYTRDGQFQFDKDGNLVSSTTGKYVMGYASSGAQDLTKISLADLRTNPPKATSTVTFSGNLNSTPTTGTVADTTLSSVVVTDSLGGLHTLSIDFKNNGTADPDNWTVTVTDTANSGVVGTGTIGFVGGSPNPSSDTMSVTYTPAGGTSFDVKLDLSSNVTSYNSGALSTLAVASQDGYGGGSISKTTFDADGKLSITYSNGQTAKGAQLALANFDSNLGLRQNSGGQFESDDPTTVHMGRAGIGGLGSIEAGEIEMSNVDLSGEFSNLIVMQRGYQAASNVISTANDMLQQLFDLHGGR